MIQEPDYGAISRILVHVVIPGDPDPQSKKGLSEKGANQVFELARSRLLAGPSKIYSSGEKSCKTTAEVLAKELDTTTSKMDCLKEVDLGIKEIDLKFLKEEMKEMWENLEYSPKSGESLLESQKRISQCIDRLAKAHPDSIIGLVLPPIISILFHTLIVGGVPTINDWFQLGYASCATYEYSKNGWTLVMPPENSFLSEPTYVQDHLSEEDL